MTGPDAAASDSRRLRLVPAAIALALLAGCGVPSPPPSQDRFLEGTEPVRVRPLADLALERARMGGRWLLSHQKPAGWYVYWYHPDDDTEHNRDYNEIRHAGTTYSLYKLYGVTHDRRLLAAGDRAIGYIERLSIRRPGLPGRGFAFNGSVRLGSQALAIIALLERRRVTGDTRYDRLIADMTAFLLRFEVRGQPGRLYPRYLVHTGRFALLPPSDYFPGEALLALTRMAEQFPRDRYRADAERVANYLIRRKDGDIAAAGRIPREDHWLTLALSELYRLHRDPDYRKVAYMEAEHMVATQHRSAAHPGLIGSSAEREPVNYTSTATKGEAMAAAWGLARFAGDRREARRFAHASERNIQFSMRVQFTEHNTTGFPRPAGAIGAWPQDPEVDHVRVDFVQHNMSNLLDARVLMLGGDVPLGRPLPGARTLRGG